MNRAPITHVAIRFRGKVYSLPKPNRHHDVIRHIAETEGVERVNSYGPDQGFLDARGSYLTRQQAWAHAVENEQVSLHEAYVPGTLFSEDVW